jgi:predicted RNase H-like HicB family nuclease
MELALQIHIEQLPEGVYLATSDDLPGLVAQGGTVAEPAKSRATWQNN